MCEVCARRAATCCALILLLLVPGISAAQGRGALTGAVLDPLGSRVPGATVTLLGDQGPAGETRTGPDGIYEFPGLAPGRYRIMATAPLFDAVTSAAVYVGAGTRTPLSVSVHVGSLQQEVVVTVAAAAVPQSQTGAPVTVIDQDTLDALNKPDLLEALRLVPGSQVEQVGGKGGTASMFIRGGGSSFAKVLVDGVVANDIGGFVDFAQLQTTGVERVEVLRQSNSVVYGSDALTGVLDIATRRGRTRVPRVSYSIDGGNLETFRNSIAGGGAVGRFDYFSEYSYFATDNELPNNRYRNHSYAGRGSVALGGGTDVSATLRLFDTSYGTPNAVALYGIPDDSSSTAEALYAGVTAQSQWNDRWQSTIRFGSTGRTSTFLNPAPTGTPFDPFGFGANYLGELVTITGANGYSTTGQAILDFGGVYPSTFESRATRRALSGQTTYTVSPAFSVSGGARFEREQGFNDPEGEATLTRNNGGVFAEVRGSVGGRTYVTAGLGYEHNAVFESATTPRLAVATYLREPSAGAVGDTKVTFNIGKGIKAPSVFQEQNSLFTLVQGTPAAPDAEPIGPERSRNVDVGLEQGLVDGQVRVRLSYFHNRFEDLIEFVDQHTLPQLGVPPEVAQATGFGAYVNSSSYTAQGMEVSGEALLMARLRLMASYTFTDAEVSESFAGSALAPAFNPSIPGVPIGAFSPLVGQRPFRLPAHAGSLLASYTEGRAQVTLSAYFSGRRNGSTFLSDAFFGTTMLLPNEDLEDAYQKVDLGGSYRVHPRLRAFVSVENLFDQAYEASFGFPALPRTARGGVTVELGDAR